MDNSWLRTPILFFSKFVYLSPIVKLDSAPRSALVVAQLAKLYLAGPSYCRYAYFLAEGAGVDWQTKVDASEAEQADLFQWHCS
jgi:hypothetical protein